LTISRRACDGQVTASPRTAVLFARAVAAARAGVRNHAGVTYELISKSRIMS